MTDRTTGPRWGPAVERAIHRAGESGTFLLVAAPRRAPAGLDESAFAGVRAAIGVANEAVRPATTLGSFVARVQDGVSVLVHGNFIGQDTTTDWLSAFTRAVDDALGAWRLVLPRKVLEIPEVMHWCDRTYPTAFLGYRMNAYRPLTDPWVGWQVAGEDTRRLAKRHADWLQAGSSVDTVVRTPYGEVRVGGPDVSGFFVATAPLSQATKEAQAHAHGERARRKMSWTHLGQCVTQTVQPDAPWQPLLEEQVSRLLVDPTATDVGMIRAAGPSAGGWDNVDFEWMDYSYRPAMFPVDYDRNRHLWDEYVIDAAGVQLLTGKHLAHAHDLGDWNVETVAEDRYLVSARHLEPWYADVTPDPAVVAKARADFGEMILSWEAILANPGPYSVTDSPIVGRRPRPALP